MRDVVQVHISSGLQIRAQALGFANRIEVRLGKAFPVALIVDRDAVDPFMAAIAAGRAELMASDGTESEKGDKGDGC